MLITALATPFTDKKELDLKSFHRLLQHQKRGADGVVVAGTTGQGSLLSMEEKRQLLEATLDYPFGRGLCVSDTCLPRVFENMELATKFGAHFILVTPPFFIKPTQEAILAFFQEVLDQSSCPVILYNNPSRVAVAIDNGVYTALKGHKNLFGVKESANKASLKGIEIPVFCGDDEQIMNYAEQGAMGAISVLSNVFVDTVKKGLALDPEANRMIHHLKQIYIATNPLPIQYVLMKNHIFSFADLKKEMGSLNKEQEMMICQILEETWEKSTSAF
ncbi:MAG: dihydrodipicolinate synthase family protein [Chlamydiia bacterium]